MAKVDEKWRNDTIASLKDMQEKELQHFEKRINDSFKHMNANIDGLKEEINKAKKETSERIDLVKETIHNQLDEFDRAFRGNSKIGVFEQLRSIDLRIKIIFVLIILLFGFKFFGSSIYEWWEEFIKFPGMKIEQKVDLPKIEEKPTIVIDESWF
tara:strand:+ start:125 stop:589 length:465 start_codon:yes stop_codon:yes gene_type:complete